MTGFRIPKTYGNLTQTEVQIRVIFVSLPGQCSGDTYGRVFTVIKRRVVLRRTDRVRNKGNIFGTQKNGNIPIELADLKTKKNTFCIRRKQVRPIVRWCLFVRKGGRKPNRNRNEFREKLFH